MWCHWWSWWFNFISEPKYASRCKMSWNKCPYFAKNPFTSRTDPILIKIEYISKWKPAIKCLKKSSTLCFKSRTANLLNGFDHDCLEKGIRFLRAHILMVKNVWQGQSGSGCLPLHQFLPASIICDTCTLAHYVTL